MRASQLIAGLLVMGALQVAACGDDGRKTSARGAEAGAAGEASGGSATDAAAGGAAGATTEAAAGGGARNQAGGSSCLVEPGQGQPDDYLAEMASGTRIEARYFAAKGMPNVFAGFYDTQLEQWCDFMLASDDKLRCLPRSTSSTESLGYSDANCSKRAEVLSVACATATGYFRNRLECLDKAEVRELVPYTGATYLGSPGNCQDADHLAPANSYTVGAELPPASFVEGTLVDLPGVCRASLRVVETADGARGPFQIFDIGSGIGCDADFGGCKPVRLAFEEPTLFSDDTCETEATGYASWINEESCGPPDFVRPDAADFDFWYRVGPVADAELYSAPGGCEPALDKPWIGSGIL